MVLQVDFDRFADEVKTRLGSQDAYAAATSAGTRVTAGDAATGFLLLCDTPKPLADARTALEAKGLTVRAGGWSAQDAPPAGAAPSELYLAAVAYQSSEPKPGVWVDAFELEPTPQEVLVKLFEEFRANGEIADVAFEEFLRLASPNVVVVRPEQMRYFVEQKLK